MGVKVNIPVLLSHLTDGIFEVNVPGSTVGDVRRNTVKKFPKLKDILFPADGQLDEFIQIALNEHVLTTGDNRLSTRVSEGDNISILIPLAGG